MKRKHKHWVSRRSKRRSQRIEQSLRRWPYLTRDALGLDVFEEHPYDHQPVIDTFNKMLAEILAENSRQIGRVVPPKQMRFGTPPTAIE